MMLFNKARGKMPGCFGLFAFPNPGFLPCQSPSQYYASSAQKGQPPPHEVLFPLTHKANFLYFDLKNEFLSINSMTKF